MRKGIGPNNLGAPKSMAKNQNKLESFREEASHLDLRHLKQDHLQHLTEELLLNSPLVQNHHLLQMILKEES